MSKSARERPSDVEMLAMASVFDLIPYDPKGIAGLMIRQLRVERRQLDPETWAIVSDGNFVMNHEGEWEYEPFPSSRDDAFLVRCRWPTAHEAIQFALSHMEQYPSGYKPDDETT